MLKECGIMKLPEGDPVLDGDYLHTVPVGMPKLDGVYTLSMGVELGKPAKGYIEPAHALAMTLDASGVKRSVELDDASASLFMQGEALTLDSEGGWTLMLWHGMPLGWGKSAGGIIKNHLPKGLRLRGGHALKQA